MTSFTKLRHPFRRSPTATTLEITPTADIDIVETGKDDVNANTSGEQGLAEKPTEVQPAQDAQRGVQGVEAVTLTWSKKSLIAIFINMWLLYFVNGFQASILYNLVPYATSDFETHSLLTVIYVVANAMSAAVYIPLAKVLDVWGRAEGYLFMACLATLGLVLMATSHGLSSFCAAYVFYSIGFGGMTYCIDVITADASKLKNRGLAYAFTSSPYIITAFAGPKASDDFLTHISWRWGFGCFAIIFPVVAAPLYGLLRQHVRKAQQQGLLVRSKSGRTVLQSIWHYTVEFDLAGVVLFATGLTVFLLPFTLAESAPDGWKSDYIIAMIVIGFALLAAFILYESYVAPTPFIKYDLLRDRTVIGAFMLDGTYQVSYYCWNSYFSSFLQVVNNLTVAEAGYVGSTFDVVGGVLLLLVGYAMRRTGRFKWLLYFAVPLYIFAQGLMIYFRRPNGYIGYIVMCQIFISVGGSIFIIIEQVAMLAAVDHQHVAAALALLYVVGNVGGAIGNTISGAIWTNTFKNALERNLPPSALPELDAIYSDLYTQLSYDVGTPERRAIQEAYGYAQTRMLTAGTCIMGLAFVWVLMIRNIDIHKKQQVQGMVF